MLHRDFCYEHQKMYVGRYHEILCYVEVYVVYGLVISKDDLYMQVGSLLWVV